MSNRIALTPGEPAGIGPDLCIAATRHPPPGAELVIVGDRAVLEQRAAQLNLPLSLKAFSGSGAADGPSLIQVDAPAKVIPGQLDPANAGHVLECLRVAVDRVMRGELDALVTGPVHKGNINEAGFAFTGHTEFLAELCGMELTVMMLATEGLRVALATTHLPLARVPEAINRELLQRVITIVHDDLVAKFGIEHPTILVCGLNPHAGESGHLGREEMDIIEPALETLQKAGMDLIGPLPADTLFTPRYLDHADAVLSMYHDQGLPVLKFKGFGNASNITLGLPMIRTSVDHGTALELAGTGKAGSGSLYNAIATANTMIGHWNNHAPRTGNH